MDILARKINHLTLFSPYGYTPSLAAGLVYVILFGIVTLVHLVLAVRFKYWVLFATLIAGGILEVLGWAGRLWSHFDDKEPNAFIMQICTLIIGPAFFSAWAYTLLGFCIARLGAAYSLLKPRWYLVVFVAADIISLVLQAIGGGGAAVKAQDGEDTKSSTRIMLAGILFQLGTMTIFSALAIDFIVRVILRRPYASKTKSAMPADGNNVDVERAAPTEGPERTGAVDEGTEGTEVVDEGTEGTEVVDEGTEGTEGAEKLHHFRQSFNTSLDLQKVKYLLAGVAFASLMIYVRGVYRSVELAQGWDGYVITHEDYFIWLDGLPMVLCLIAFAIAHPGWLLPPRQGWKRA